MALSDRETLSASATWMGNINLSRLVVFTV